MFNHYGYDEQNSLNQTRLLVKVGGGMPDNGPVGGIHWHMNVANKIDFAYSDDRRQVIPWVRMTDDKGNVTEFVAQDAKLSQRSDQRAADAPAWTASTVITGRHIITCRRTRSPIARSTRAGSTYRCHT